MKKDTEKTMTTKNRIIELANTIQNARDAYYNGQAVMSDASYDKLYDELAKLDPENPAITGIGAEPVSEWKKYKHEINLGSLNKSNTEEEFIDWAKDYCNDEQFFITWKLDGLSVSLVYEDGKLVVGATRGSGVEGENIFANVIRMQGVPKTLPKKINATVRGEIVLSKSNHRKYFADYSNARNSASGVSRRFDGEGSQFLNVIVYQIRTDNIELKTMVDQFNLLQELGFTTPDYSLFDNAKDAYAYFTRFQDEIRDTVDIDLDGLVCSNNNIEKFEDYGYTHNRPKGAIAMKFENECAETVLREVVWQVGNGGRIVPVAIFDPIMLAGAEIERATLHNVSRVKELMLYIGCGIVVSRRNEVIPFVESRL
jgi:DNA ligase (NAD+)